MKAKKEYAVLFLVLIVGVSTFMSVCRAEDLSVDEEFELYVDYLDDYLADPYSADSYDINSLCDSIGEVRGHAGDIGMAFYAYAMVIRDLDQEEWDSVNFNLSIIDSITDFEEYVSSEEFRKEHRQIKGVDVLRTYCEGRIAEANNQWREAAECYMATVSFYDSFSRLQIAQTNQGQIIDEQKDPVEELLEQGTKDGMVISYDDHTYMVFDKQGLTWEEAEHECESYGGHLVCINSPEEQSIIEVILQNGSLGMYWIGGYRTQNDKFMWVDGTIVEYNNVDEEIPFDNYRKIENYLQILRLPNPNKKNSRPYTWNDAPIDNTIPDESFFGIDNIGFICEWSDDEVKEQDYEIGSIVIFGSYDQDNDIANGAEPIEWLVLDNNEETCTLISKYGLDAQPYNTRDTSVTWETCTLRTWLNEDFMSTAFTVEEQTKLATVSVTADKNPSYSIDPGNDTQDNVFLLSINEVKRYFDSNDARVCIPTKTAVSIGAESDSKMGGSKWWLRSPGNKFDSAAVVDPDGSVYNYGSYICRESRVVRPVVVLRLR